MSFLISATNYEYSIISAELVPASDEAPEFCRVLGMLPPDAHNVNMPSRPMNWLLTKVMSAERHILPSLSVPAGHSLIGLATKPEAASPRGQTP